MLNSVLILSIVLVTIAGFSFLIQESEAVISEEDLIILQTGIISTSDKDYTISDDFKTRIFHDGNLMRISGTTTSGNPYFVYYKLVEEELTVKGKIMEGNKFVSIVIKPQTAKGAEPEPDVEAEPTTELTMIVKQNRPSFWGQSFSLTARVYDAELNPREDFGQNWGYLANVTVTVSITDDEGNLITTLEGQTTDLGYYDGDFLINRVLTPTGTYTVTVTADNGQTTIVDESNFIVLGPNPLYYKD